MGHRVLLLDGYLSERSLPVGAEDGIVSESFSSLLLEEDGTFALAGDDYRLTVDVASDAALERRGSVLDAFHQCEDAFVPDGLLTVCRVNTRETLQSVYEHPGIVDDDPLCRPSPATPAPSDAGAG